MSWCALHHSQGLTSAGVVFTAGTVKITPTIAWTTSMLAWGMLTFGNGYNKSGTDVWAKARETLRWNADYLLKTVKDDPVSSAISTKPEFYIDYQVGGCNICSCVHYDVYHTGAWTSFVRTMLCSWRICCSCAP